MAESTNLTASLIAMIQKQLEGKTDQEQVIYLARAERRSMLKLREDQHVVDCMEAFIMELRLMQQTVYARLDNAAEQMDNARRRARANVTNILCPLPEGEQDEIENVSSDEEKENASPVPASPSLQCGQMERMVTTQELLSKSPSEPRLVRRNAEVWSVEASDGTK